MIERLPHNHKSVPHRAILISELLFMLAMIFLVIWFIAVVM